MNPSPDNYNPKFTITNDVPKQFSFGYRGLSNKEMTKVPGPGTYDIGSSNGFHSVRNKISSKRKKKKRGKKALTSRS